MRFGTRAAVTSANSGSESNSRLEVVDHSGKQQEEESW